MQTHIHTYTPTQEVGTYLKRRANFHYCSSSSSSRLGPIPLFKAPPAQRQALIAPIPQPHSCTRAYAPPAQHVMPANVVIFADDGRNGAAIETKPLQVEWPASARYASLSLSLSLSVSLSVSLSLSPSLPPSLCLLLSASCSLPLALSPSCSRSLRSLCVLSPHPPVLPSSGSIPPDSPWCAWQVSLILNWPDTGHGKETPTPTPASTPNTRTRNTGIRARALATGRHFPPCLPHTHTHTHPSPRYCTSGLLYLLHFARVRSRSLAHFDPSPYPPYRPFLYTITPGPRQVYLQLRSKPLVCCCLCEHTSFPISTDCAMPQL